MVGQLYPAVVQRFQVVPNELRRETPYIDESLKFTRMGYVQDQMERRPAFEARAEGHVDWRELRAQRLAQPADLESGDPADHVQGGRRPVRVLRFPDRGVRPLSHAEWPGPRSAISVREVDPLGIDHPNWQNLHLAGALRGRQRRGGGISGH